MKQHHSPTRQKLVLLQYVHFTSCSLAQSSTNKLVLDKSSPRLCTFVLATDRGIMPWAKEKTSLEKAFFSSDITRESLFSSDITRDSVFFFGHCPNHFHPPSCHSSKLVLFIWTSKSQRILLYYRSKYL